MKNRFVKSHGLGNDYIVMDADNITFPINKTNVKIICDVHYGIGSDGLLIKMPSSKTDFKVEMFNPDGSKFEKSGNGLRIFSKYLYDYGFTENKIFSIETDGGIVHAKIIKTKNGKVKIIKIDMGIAEFVSAKIPVNIPKDKCINERLQIKDEIFYINAVSMGNPHCVVFREQLNIDEIMEYGTLIENHKIFPNRTNVQFAKLISPNLVDILIWERGVGYTNASGSSACAVAAVLKKHNLIDEQVTVNMPGGSLDIEINDDYKIKMTGEIQQIAAGYFNQELIAIFNQNCD